MFSSFNGSFKAGRRKSRSAFYGFTSHTFTNAGASGSTGPSLAQLRSAYSAQSWAQDSAYLNVTTQGIQNWTVPESGTYEIEVVGAQGGNATRSGGLGGRATGTISLTAGTVLYILVGQQGNSTSGGWGGGGDGDTGGGGASDVRINGTGLNDRIIVGAGGGGSPNYNSSYDIVPGDGGGLTGGGPNSGSNGSNTRQSGGGGTQSAGGSGGTGNVPGNAGSFGQGGNKGSSYGGGGGGGYYGGGGGGYETSGSNYANGGGGGSSYYNTSLFTNTSTTSGVRSGDGYVKITRL